MQMLLTWMTLSQEIM